MRTTLYLIRHGAAEAEVGRWPNATLDRLGVRQAQLTRDLLAVRPIDLCYCGPSRDAVQTAQIIAEPHGLNPCIVDGLDERDGEDGEHFARLQRRVTDTLGDLLDGHPGQTLLVVAHRLAHVSYLAGVLRLTPEEAGQVRLDHCGVSVVVREGGQTAIAMLNASFHLQGIPRPLAA